MEKWKNLSELQSFYADQGDLEQEDFEFSLGRLAQSGFGEDLKNLVILFDKHPDYLSKFDEINNYLEEYRYVLVITNDHQFNTAIYSSFPILYALNTLGESVFRLSMRALILQLLNSNAAEFNADGNFDLPDNKFFSSMKRNVVLFYNILDGDNRLSSMCSSIIGIINSLSHDCRRKLLFTHVTGTSSEEVAKKNTMERISHVYSENMSVLFKDTVKPVFFKREGKSLWD